MKTGAKKRATTLAQLKLIFGMLYVTQTADGRFIIIDGGMKTAEHKQTLLDYLASKSEGKKPVIACWMFTHLDGDHVDNAFDILLTHSEELEVQCLGCGFPLREDFAPVESDPPAHNQWRKGATEIQEYAEARWEKIKALYPNTEFWEMRCDDRREIDDVKLHVLISAYERLPAAPISHNSRSAVIKMTFTQGTADESDDTTFLATGDSGGDARCEFMLNRYPTSYLQSDILQVIHHGMYGGHTEFYQAVDPKICFWPTTEARFFGYELDRDGKAVSYANLTQDLPCNAYLRDDSIRVRTHYHGEQSLEIDMSDLSVTILDEPR